MRFLWRELSSLGWAGNPPLRRAGADRLGGFPSPAHGPQSVHVSVWSDASGACRSYSSGAGGVTSSASSQNLALPKEPQSLFVRKGWFVPSLVHVPNGSGDFQRPHTPREDTVPDALSPAILPPLWDSPSIASLGATGRVLPLVPPPSPLVSACEGEGAQPAASAGCWHCPLPSSLGLPSFMAAAVPVLPLA